MIVGTAGHIDHGKTTLIRAMTGVETDRLKEEKTRGISIELGYAYTPLDNHDVLGFIDVPGHERLVHTMAAGASGIDFGLLVVAADDGVMPQTREHLAILSLLGVQQGAVAITKIDRVDAARLSDVQAEIAELVADTFLSDAPVFPLSAAMPDFPGVAALKTYLHHMAQAMAARTHQGLFRLAVDRVFTLQGHGTVVTGTVHAGSVSVNDANDLYVMPTGKPVRVRSIHAQNRVSDLGVVGQRCALNLGGLNKEDIRRGDWIADARCFMPSHNIDVELNLLASADTPVRAWSPLHVHIGAAHYLAHAVPLTHDSIAPGQSGKVQLVFNDAVCTMPGDRYIVRNAQARLTVGGGVVLDPNAPGRKRRSASRLAWLDAMSACVAGAGVAPLLAQSPRGLDHQTLTRLTGEPADDLVLPQGARWIPRRGAGMLPTLMLEENWVLLGDKVGQVLSTFHQASPDEPGVDMGRLRRMAIPTLEHALWLALCDELIDQGRLQRKGPWLHLPGHSTQLSDADQQLAAQLLDLLFKGGFDPPWPRDLAPMINRSEDDIRQLLRKQVRCGQLFQVVKDLFYHGEQVARLAALVASLSEEQGVSAATFRDATGLGRKRAIQILEFFGRIGYTRRLGDKHLLRANSMLFTENFLQF